MIRVVLGMFVVGMLLSPAAGESGVIRGVLRSPSQVPAEVRQSNPYPGRAGAMPAPRAPLRGRISDAVIYVESVPAFAESTLARRARTLTFAQKDQAFLPRVLVVASRSRVDFPNMDPIYHNVFSLSPAKRFDLGKYPRGHSKQVRFDKAGLVNVYCDIHSDMEGFVLVLPHHAFTQPNAAGEYALPDLPPGRYRLKVWHPDLPELSRSVQVPDSGSIAVDLNY